MYLNPAPNHKAVISIEPNVRGEIGHDWIYQRCIESAASFKGFPCRVLVAKDIEKSPDTWKNVLPSHAKPPRGVIANYVYLIRLISAIGLALRHKSLKANHVFLVLQSFSGMQLFAFSIASALFNRSSRKITPVVVWRYPLKEHGSEKVGISNWLMQRFTFNPTYFSDTELLVARNTSRLQHPVTLLPIPHIDDAFRKVKVAERKRPMLCWWPGAPRKLKGLDLVGGLLTRLPASASIKILAAESSGLSSANGHFQPVPDYLERERYALQMLNSDVILTPYSARAYAMNSSGIFVEAICAGKVVLSIEGTWMAHELHKFGLKEFVLSSDIDQWLTMLINLSEGNIDIQCFSEMRRKYLDFHSEKTFNELFFRG